MAEQKIKTFLMFEGGAEEAMNFYLSLFEDAEVVSINRYGAEGPGPEGSVMVAVFQLAGQQYMCSDSFQHHGFTFTPSVSMFVDCADEAELDRLYEALGEGRQALMPLGDHGFSKKFGWVNDRFGVSWQLNLPA
ncbi:VOC family protein [Kribbella solani]|uniref:VOC family protein n=1 Tax=Kribbella solani TaxID=236067 RepID=UPI0029AD6988|nr:VOC family protein [Kribbella solani]MDX3002219.1 VOC family protein [Kribbella solani]